MEPSVLDLPDSPLRRRLILTSGSLLAMLSMPSPLLAGPRKSATSPVIGFKPIAPSTADTVRVPEGYRADVLYAWGDPVSDGPAFRPDATNSAEDQALQAGMHHDGMHFFPFPLAEPGRFSASHGLLAINHEYIDDGLLHNDGQRTWSAEKVAKAQAAVGVSIIEVRLMDGGWQVVRPSRFGRRITANTACRITGPAAAHPLMRTIADPFGLTVLGTMANCANGYTPWGTYLTCEENFHGYFGSRDKLEPDSHQKRYGITAKGTGYRWHEYDARFDVSQNPNEANRFGWVVEIDPRNPLAPPVKRTALGRFKHENARLTLAKDGRVVVYMGDDERFEYLYKFVSRHPYRPRHPEEHGKLLDDGTLYVARFHDNGRGEWIPLRHGSHGLTAANGFADQGEVLIRTRQAADLVGATPMDRPEWIGVHPVTGEVYCTLTNNAKRGTAGLPPVDGPNPRANNLFGQILRWREDGDATATGFAWDLFAEGGNPTHPDPRQRGTVQGDAFGSPDGLAFDAEGRLWIQTDVTTALLNKEDYAGMGNNQMLCADPVTKVVKRFLTGPNGCEITGMTFTPDSRTLFINIQHPGETANERSNPDQPQAVSNWPDGPGGNRPRSATVVIRKDDGGVIGT